MKTDSDPSSRKVLPGKEQSAFKHMLSLYEQKHHKKAIKQADSILKKFPDHGETLAMKGLILSNLGADRKAEAFECAKRGLRLDIKSLMCWHVLGLMYRAERDYREAGKYFTQAARLDNTNYQVLRDLASIQMHERQLQQFQDTRRQILHIRARFVREWAAFALANHLGGNLDIALELLKEMEVQFGESSEIDIVERSELLLYAASILEQQGKLKECLDFLETNEKNIVDTLSLLEMQGKICIHLQAFEQGCTVYEKLLKMNKHNDCYILCYLICRSQSTLPGLFHIPVHKSAFVASKHTIGSSTKDSNESSCVHIMPCCLTSSGEDRSGWLLSNVSQAAIKQAQIKDFEMSLINKWKDATSFCPHYQPNKCNKLPDCDQISPPPRSPFFVLTRNLTDDQQDIIIKHINDIAEEHSLFPSHLALMLSFLSKERFMAHLDNYLRTQLRRGVVSVFSTLKTLYNRSRVDIIERLLTQYVDSLEKVPSTFGPSHDIYSDIKRSDTTTTEKPELPSTLLYAYMLLAQHYDFLHETNKAISVIDKAIIHTPTSVDLYLIKGRIYKHAGDIDTAADLHEQGRNLDLADRYLNTKACQYLFRAGRKDDGIVVAKLFAKNVDTDSSGRDPMHYAQCMWYERLLGLCLLKKGDVIGALEQFVETLKHFDTIKDDQFDFHSYCLRKCAFRAYVNFLQMQDKLWSHINFRRAARYAIGIYISAAPGELLASLQESELAVPKKVSETNAKQKKKPTNVVQEKKNLEKELKLEDPIAAAQDILDKLLICCLTDPNTHVLHYLVAQKKGRILGMILALGRLCSSFNNDLLKAFPLKYHFTKMADLTWLPEAFVEVANDVLSSVFGCQINVQSTCMNDLSKKIRDSFFQRINADPYNYKMIRYAVKALELTNEPISSNLNILQFTDLLPPHCSSVNVCSCGKYPSLKSCQKLLDSLSKHPTALDATKRLKVACRGRYPLANAFNSSA